MYKIYIHKNKKNGKVYIGQTRQEDLNRRFKGGSGYKGSPHFYRAIQQDGWDSFEHFVLEENIPFDLVDEREKFWIKAFDSTNSEKGYNITPGGKIKPENQKKVNVNCKAVVCKETGQIFSSLVEAALWAGMKKTSTSNITQQILGKKSSAGKHPQTGEKLHWYFLEDKDSAAEIRPSIKPGAKKVKNLDTGKIFDSINDAAKFYNISNITISKSCKTNGKLATGGNKGPKWHWCFID